MASCFVKTKKCVCFSSFLPSYWEWRCATMHWRCFFRIDDARIKWEEVMNALTKRNNEFYEIKKKPCIFNISKLGGSEIRYLYLKNYDGVFNLVFFKYFGVKFFGKVWKNYRIKFQTVTAQSFFIKILATKCYKQIANIFKTEWER